MAKKKSGSDIKTPTLSQIKKEFESDIAYVPSLDTTSGKAGEYFRTTGSILLDSILAGGYPRGTMVELFGPPGGGKSTLALSCVREVLRSGGKVVYIDLENGLDLTPRPGSWTRKNGVNPEHPGFLVISPPEGERVMQLLEELVKTGEVDLIVVDSVATITTNEDYESDIGNSRYASIARLLSASLRRIFAHLGRKNLNTNIIWINQVRDKIGGTIQGYRTVGGHALQHLCATRLDIRKVSNTLGEDENLAGIRIKIVKSRFTSLATVETQISSHCGIDTIAELITVGMKEKWVIQSGSWFYLYKEPVDFDKLKKNKEEKSEEAGFLYSVQGIAALKEYMAENGFYEKFMEAA